MDGLTNSGSGVPDAGTSEEPALTQRNTATIGGEQNLGTQSTGAAPTYGPAGDTADAEEEGADDGHHHGSEEK